MSGRVFLDTNIFIHAYDTPREWKGKDSAKLIERIIKGEQKAATSYLVLNEVLYYYMREGRDEEAKRFWDNATNMHNLSILPIDQKAGAHVMEFISEGLDATDAFHAAVMAANGIETICSYDKAFDKIKGIKRQEPK